MEADEESEETEETHQNCSRHVLCMCDFCVHSCAMCMGYEFMRFMSDV